MSTISAAPTSTASIPTVVNAITFPLNGVDQAAQSLDDAAGRDPATNVQLSEIAKFLRDGEGAQPVQVTRSFNTGLTADGYAISATANSADGSFNITVHGPNGFNFTAYRTGGPFRNDFAGGSQGGAKQEGNFEYITDPANGRTIAIDFRTGQISVAPSDAAGALTSAQTGQPASTFSTVA